MSISPMTKLRISHFFEVVSYLICMASVLNLGFGFRKVTEISSGAGLVLFLVGMISVIGFFAGLIGVFSSVRIEPLIRLIFAGLGLIFWIILLLFALGYDSASIWNIYFLVALSISAMIAGLFRPSPQEWERY